MTYTMQPFPTLMDSDPTDLMNAINQIARIRLQDIANQTNVNKSTQNIATTGIIACTATGTNTIALQQNANQTVISGYQNYQQFSFVSVHNSTGAVTVNINGFGALNLYQTDGATQATSGTLTAGALYNISYNSALNSNAGGFQIVSGSVTNYSGTAPINITSNVISFVSGVLSNSLASDVNINNESNYFDGPSVVQGTSGTWFVVGTVTCIDTTTNGFIVKLWDGTTLIASTKAYFVGGNVPIPITLGGYISSPAGNLRLSVNNPSDTTGKITYNNSGLGKDSTITAFRIG
jgi:hypothetical protein